MAVNTTTLGDAPAMGRVGARMAPSWSGYRQEGDAVVDGGRALVELDGQGSTRGGLPAPASRHAREGLRGSAGDTVAVGQVLADIADGDPRALGGAPE